MTFSLYGGFGLESVSWEDWQIGSIRLGHHFLLRKNSGDELSTTAKIDWGKVGICA